MMPSKAALTFAAAVAAALAAAPALAAQPGEDQQPQAETPGKSKPEVVERDDKGRATIVRIEGVDYKVCHDGVTDGCINPRSAGLDFGNHDLRYWPGKPASEIEEPLPWQQPEQQGEQQPVKQGEQQSVKQLETQPQGN